MARALAGWREQRAVAADKPRGWILTDEALYALATLAPATTTDLEQVRALPPSVIRKRGDELLELVRAARESADEGGPQPATQQRPTPEQTRRIGALQQRVRDVAASLEISPEILATRRDVEGMVLGSPEHSAAAARLAPRSHRHAAAGVAAVGAESAAVAARPSGTRS